jgi:hypothetical protein
VPTELSDKNVAAPPPDAITLARDGELREWARRHVERVHKLKRDVAIFLLGIVTLTGIWAVVAWQDNGAFERLSDNGNQGDWNPWILYVALVWGFFVVLDALKVYFDRPTTETEIERTMERLRSSR